MPVAHDYAEAYLKLQRADRHIAEVEYHWAAYIQTDFYHLVFQENTQGGHEGIKVRVDPLPPEISLSIGDAVHCLRCALDYSITNIIGGSRTSFPSHEERDSLIESFSLSDGVKKGGRHASIRQLCTPLADFIIDTIQPYKTGNVSLWAIGKLDNADKHRLLTVMTIISRLSGVYRDGPFIIEDCTFLLRDPDSFLIGTPNSSRKFDVKKKGKATADIRFGKGDAFENDPIVPTLVQLRNAAFIAIASISEFLNGV